MSKFSLSTKYLLVAAIFLVVIAAAYAATNQDIRAGRSYYLEIESFQDTDRWAALKVVDSGADLTPSINSFITILANTAVISEVNFPGTNLNDGNFYYGAMFPSTFSALNIVPPSDDMLEPNGIFNSSNFPQFYPDYTIYADNPNVTFCCDKVNISIGGTDFEAFNTTIPTNSSYYLLPYNDSGEIIPLFLSDLENATCFNGTLCISQFLLPLSSTNYNFFAISKKPAFNITVFIDGVQTNTMSQVALPYNLSIIVRDLYTAVITNNTDVVVSEAYGKTLFIPYRLDGYIRDLYTIGRTNDDGEESFLIAPTGYPSVTGYEITVGVLIDDEVLSPETLTITTLDSLSQTSKPVSPSRLSDNAKASVNSMNQIGNFLFIWSSQREEAKSWDITYETSNNTWTILDEVNLGSTLVLKTGAPNVLDVEVQTLGVPQAGYTYRVVEEGGLLIMNPYTDNSPLTATNRFARQQVDSGDEIVVTPTELGSIDSNVSIEIIDSLGMVIAEYNATINATLNIDVGGVTYDNDLLKTIANSMNQILNSLFYALNL